MKGDTLRTVDELEQKPIDNVTGVGEFDWEEMSEAELARVIDELRAAKRTYRDLPGECPYSLRKKISNAQDEMARKQHGD